MSKQTFLTLGQAAKQLGCKTWQLQRAFERGILEEPSRIGQWRIVALGELPKIRAALVKVGYVKK